MKINLTTILLLALFSQLSAQSGHTSKVLKSAEVYFDFGKYDLRPQTDSSLAVIAAFCKELKDFQIRIAAHTDSVGTLQSNLTLSKHRAEAIQSFLVEKGVPAKNIAISFFGKTRPATENDSEEGRQLNRRASIEILQVVPEVGIEGFVKDEKTGNPLAALVVIQTKETRDSIRTDTSGYFKTAFPSGTVVRLDAFAECHFLKSEMVKARPGMQPVQLLLKPALVGESADIENLFFVGNQATLLEKSRPELPKLLRFMQLSPKMKIEIAGHVNFPNRPPVARESFEYKLSVERAKIVYDYLLNNGIQADRISYQGYGNFEMRYPYAVSESQQQQNRRVEIRILQDGCP